MMKRRLPYLAALVVALVTSGVWAQQSTDGPYILHEFFAGDVSGTDGTGAGDGPEANAAPPTEGGPPALSMEPRNDELIYGAEGPVDDGRWEEPYGSLNPFSSQNKLDANTDRVNSLNYFASFEPSVIPYKRVVAQNQVLRTAAGEYRMQLLAGDRREIRIGQAIPSGHELFWGSFMVRTEPSRWHPMASVAPHQTLLDVRSEPEVDLTFYRDDAGNFYFRTNHRGLLRLNVRVAVEPFYFSGEFPDVAWSDFRGLSKPVFPEDAGPVALRVLQKIGVNQSMPPTQVMTRMVEYFRNFEARPLPPELASGDDLYETIASSQIGVCRHRSLAFVITAQYLGIPAHYVYNEAHAFVEVEWPNVGWRRIDLGGAADELNAASADSQTIHTPDDPLPRPDRYVQEQERMEHNGWKPRGEGAQGGQEREASESAEASPPGSNEGLNEGDAVDGQSPAEGAGQAEGVPMNAEASLPPDDERESTRLELDEATSEVKRGGAIRVLARLTDSEGRPLPFRDVEVHIGAVGSERPGQRTRVGVVETDSRGRIVNEIAVPRNHAIGRWSLFLVFPGDEDYRPVLAY